MGNTIQDSKLLKAALAGLAIAFLTSCGSSTKVRTSALSSSSSAAVPTTTLGPAATSQCNQFSAGTSLSGKVTTYYYNGVLQDTQLRLRVNSIATQFQSNPSMYLQFFRWNADASGNVNLDSNPISFNIEAGSNGTVPFTGMMNSLSGADIDQFRYNGGIPGTTVQDFFNNTIIVLSGTDYSWSAIKAVLYNGSSPVATADFLIPIFSANPNTYGASHPAVLNQIHPFWSLRASTGLGDADWSARANAFCF